MAETSRYRITDPKTGRALIVRGDHQPTQEEAAEIFASQPARTVGEAAKKIQPPEHEQKAYDVYGMKSAPMSVRAAGDTVPQKARAEAIRRATNSAPVAGMYGEDNPIYTDEAGEPRIYNPPGVDVGDIPSILPTLAEAAGSTGGAIGGAAVGGLPGAVLGSGAGATLGREGVERGSMALQGIDDPRTALEQAIEAGSTFTANAGGEAVGALAGAGVRASLKNRGRMGATPKEIQERIDAAKLFDTNPSWAVATGSPGAEGFEGWLANYPGGHGVFRGKAAEQAVNIAGAVKDKINRLTPGGGVADSVVAGKVAREGIEGFNQRFKDNAQAMYQRVDQEIPSTQKMPATRTLELLKSYAAKPAGLEDSAESLQSRALADFAARFQKDMVVGGGVAQMDSLRFIRSALGRKMGQWSLNDDLPKAELKNIYRTLTQDIRHGIQEFGSDKALKLFDDANKYYLENLEKMDDLLEPLIKNKVPEKVFAAVENASRTSPTVIKALRESHTNEQWQVVAGSLIERLGKTKPGQGGLENFSIANFLRNYESIQAAGGDDMLNAVFGGPGMGNMKENLGKLAQFSQDTKRSSQAFFNPSGTAKNVSGATMAMGAIASAVTGDPRFALGLIAVMGNANRTAKLLTSPKFVAWLAQSTKIAPTGAGSHLGRLTGIALSSDPDTRDAIAEYAADLSQMQPQGQQ